MTAARDADLIVVGAGPAGATVARLLALQGRRPLMIDLQGTSCDRLEVIAPAVLPVVNALGLMSLLADATVAQPCLGIRRQWGNPPIRPETDEFLRRPGGRGFVVDRRCFDLRLRQAAQEAGVQLRRGRIIAVQREAGGISLLLRDGAGEETLRAQSVIDATGRPASVARRLGARLHRAEKLVAERVATACTGDPGAPNWLEVVAGRDNWSYSIAGPAGRSEVWRIARQSSRLRPLACKVIDASSGVLSRAAGPGWMAVGDAATAFDPITSQGLANAFGTALAVAGAIASKPHPTSNEQQGYSDLVLMTFTHSEWQRRKVYRLCERW